MGLRWQEFVTVRIASDGRGRRFQRWGVARADFQLTGATLNVMLCGHISGSAVERHFAATVVRLSSNNPGSPDSLFLKTGTLDARTLNRSFMFGATVSSLGRYPR